MPNTSENLRVGEENLMRSPGQDLERSVSAEGCRSLLNDLWRCRLIVLSDDAEEGNFR